MLVGYAKDSYRLRGFVSRNTSHASSCSWGRASGGATTTPRPIASKLSATRPRASRAKRAMNYLPGTCFLAPYTQGQQFDEFDNWYVLVGEADRNSCQALQLPQQHPTAVVSGGPRRKLRQSAMSFIDSMHSSAKYSVSGAKCSILSWASFTRSEETESSNRGLGIGKMLQALK